MISSTPADDATDISTSTSISLRFSENIKAGSGNISIKYGANLFENISVTGPSANFSNEYLTLTLGGNLAAGTNYHVLIPSGAVLDLSDNSYAGISDSTTLDFTTAYNNCNINGGITNATSPHNISFIVSHGTTTSIACDTNYALVGNQISCNNGTFTSVPSCDRRPYITSRNPADNSTGVSADSNFEFSYNENVTPQAVPVQIQRKISGNWTTETSQGTLNANNSSVVTITGPNSLRLNPPNDLVSGGEYRLYFLQGFVKDTNGLENLVDYYHNFTVANNCSVNGISNAAGDHSSNFDITHNQWETVHCVSGYTLVGVSSIKCVDGGLIDGSNNPVSAPTCVDNSAPTLSSTSPGDEGAPTNTNDTNTNLTLNFSENVQKGTGNITIYNSNGSVFEQIPIGDARITVSNQNVTINPNTNFNSGAQYYVQIDSTAIKDLENNNYAGISNNTTYNFSTLFANCTAPGVTGAVYPHNSSFDINHGANATVICNNYHKLSTSGVVSCSNGSVTGTPNCDPKPTFDSFNPADGATNINPAPTISVTLSESVTAGSGKARLYKSSNLSTAIQVIAASSFVFSNGNKTASITLSGLWIQEGII